MLRVLPALALVVVVVLATIAYRRSRRDEPDTGLRRHAQLGAEVGAEPGRLAPRRAVAPVAHSVIEVFDRAVARGQLSRDAADAILAAEALDAQRRVAAAPARRGPPATAEAIGYVGATLALVGVAVLIGQFWDHFEQWSRLALLGGTAAVLFLVGALLHDEHEPVIWRLRNFTWLLSVGALAGFTGLLAVDTFHWEGEAVTTMVGTAVTVYSLALWRNKDLPAPHATTYVGALVGCGGVMGIVDGAAAVGVAMIVIGALWAIAGGRGLLQPSWVALPLGLVAVLIGPAVTNESWRRQAPLLGLVIAVTLVAVGSVVGEFLITGAGVVGVMAYLPYTLGEWFGEQIGAPAILLISGLLLLVVMFVLLRRKPKPDAGPKRSGGHHFPHGFSTSH